MCPYRSEVVVHGMRLKVNLRRLRRHHPPHAVFLLSRTLGRIQQQEVRRNGRWTRQIPPFVATLSTSQSTSAQPRHIPHRTRVHHDNMAQSQRSPTTRRKAHYIGKEEHDSLPTRRPSYSICTFLSIFNADLEPMLMGIGPPQAPPQTLQRTPSPLCHSSWRLYTCPPPRARERRSSRQCYPGTGRWT